MAQSITASTAWRPWPWQPYCRLLGMWHDLDLRRDDEAPRVYRAFPGALHSDDRMAERPRVVSTNPVKWDIYLARPSPAKLLGVVEAVSERAAIAKAAKEFKQDPAKLIAVRRR
jgi:hypothetical protein